jgi:hypothetical protein
VLWGDLVSSNPIDQAKNGVKYTFLVDPREDHSRCGVHSQHPRYEAFGRHAGGGGGRAYQVHEEAPQHLYLDKSYDNVTSEETTADYGYFLYIWRI